MKTAVKGRYILDFNLPPPHIIENGVVLIDGNSIINVGRDLDTTGYEIAELKDHVIMPGLINTHSHAAMTLFRGYADDIPLDRWLNDYIWPMEAKLTPEMVEIGAKLAAIELIRSGTTTMNSMYWQPESELKAFSEIGVRLLAGPPIISGVNELEANKHLFEKWHTKNDDLVRVSLNPHAPYTVTGEEYQQIHQFKEEYNQKSDIPIMVHTHLAETKFEMSMMKEYAKKNGIELGDDVTSPTKYMEKLGILDSDLIAAHVIECTPEDLDILHRNNVGLALNPVSNMKLGNGMAKIHRMQEKGMKIGLGTDGPASNNTFDLFETMKMSTLIQKSHRNDPSVLSATQVLEMATKGGAEVLGWKGIGELKPNAKADLIAIDLKQPHLLPVFNVESIPSLLVYSARGSDVTDVMINGKWRLRNRRIPDIDVRGIMDQFQDKVVELLNS